MFDDVEYFNRFIQRTGASFLSDDEIDVHIGVDKIAVSAAPHGAFDAHEAMFLKMK